MKSDADYLAHFDHFDPDIEADPHRAYAVMREKCPISRTDAHGGFLIVSSYEGLNAVASDWETFSSESPLIARAEEHQEASKGQERLDRTFLTMDPPDHELHRRPLQSYFSPGSVARVESQVRRRAVDLIDGFVANGRCDLVDDYAKPLTMATIAQFFGLSKDEMDSFADYSYASMSLDPDESAKGREGTQRLLTGIIQKRRESTGDDVLSALINTTIEGRPLAESAIVRACFVLLSAGFETTQNAIATSLWYLAEHPDVRTRLVENEGRVKPVLVEEFLRLLAPLSSGRTATRDVVIEGKLIEKGDRLLLAFPSGNRDSCEFDQPDEFVFDRDRNRHITFGAGIHRCIGMHLARLEIRVALEQVLHDIPGYGLDPDRPVQWSFGRTQAWGARHLPVVFERRNVALRSQDPDSIA